MKFPETKNKIVCIVATGYAWDDCVFGNPNKDYWTLNNMNQTNVSSDVFDEWFQLHRPGSDEGHIDDIPMREFLASWKKPCWIQKDWKDEITIANPYIYPIDEIVQKYCPKNATGKPYPYFTNTIDYMICLAILRGYKEVQLHGVEFISVIDDEYYKMRQSVNYYIGKAEGLGIRIVIQPHSSLLKNDYWYAYENPKRDPLEKAIKSNLESLTKQKDEIDAKIRQEEKKSFLLDGGTQVLRQVLKIASLRDKGAQI